MAARDLGGYLLLVACVLGTALAMWAARYYSPRRVYARERMRGFLARRAHSRP
jgi:uncharacterized membrane protein YdjX (TVP38/TMEM64 family)